MSASRNPDAMNPAQGEFHSRVPRAEPMTTKGHAPGVKVGNDAYPEFNVEKYPPGTAPAENSYRPNTEGEVPGQAFNETMEPSTRTSASDTVPGATSGSIHNATDFGRPVQGQTSSELHGGKRKKERSGLEGVGANASGGTVFDKARATGADLEGRAADMKGEKGASGAVEGGTAWQGADERIPASAEEVAAERD